MKESTKKYLKLSLILYVVILSVAVIGTLAWFNVNRTVRIPNDEANILTGKNVEICIKKEDEKDEKWGSTIELTQIDKIPDVSMTPDGTFWYPTTLNKEDGLIYGSEGRGLYANVTNDEGYFVKIPLKVRSNMALSVYLDGTSYIKGNSIDENETVTVNPDAIAGASRVAFFEVKNGSKTLKTVWIPNEKYQLIEDANKQYRVNLIGAAEPNYSYLNVKNGILESENTATEKWQANQLSVGENALVSCEDSSDESKPVYVRDAVPLLTFEEAGVKELEIYVWIEGTDRESNTALAGGSISYALSLIGVEAKEEPAIDIAQVTYSNGGFYVGEEDVSAQILYSVDNVNWTAYAPNNPKVSKIKAIRVAETKTTKLGEPREFSIS